MTSDEEYALFKQMRTRLRVAANLPVHWAERDTVDAMARECIRQMEWSRLAGENGADPGLAPDDWEPPK